MSRAAATDSITIAGGGIGGLVAALSLARAGFEVDVYEAVDDLQPLGVGINLLPHAVCELDALGLLDRLADESVAPTTLAYLTQAR